MSNTPASPSTRGSIRRWAIGALVLAAPTIVFLALANPRGKALDRIIDKAIGGALTGAVIAAAVTGLVYVFRLFRRRPASRTSGVAAQDPTELRPSTSSADDLLSIAASAPGGKAPATAQDGYPPLWGYEQLLHDLPVPDFSLRFDRDWRTFLQRAEDGNTCAQLRAGVALLHGIPLADLTKHYIDRDVATALKLLTRAATGSPPALAARAQYVLGTVFEAGTDDGRVSEDAAIARKWYRSASPTVPHAAYRLAGMMVDGRGGPVDLDQAIALYTLATDIDDAAQRIEL